MSAMNSGFTRRQFLAASASASVTLPALCGRSSAARTASGPRVLVLLELEGGNDGLNTVVPVRADRYRKARPTLRVDADEAHVLDDESSFHPSLEGLAGWFEEGQVAVVQAVGYDNPNRSHFESRDIWHSASRELTEGRHTGWVGRVADWMVERRPGCTPAMAIGVDRVPLALRGLRTATPVVRDLRSLVAPEGGAERVEIQKRLARELDPGAGDGLSFLRRAAEQALEQRERLRQAVAGYESSVEYPQTALGQQLNTAAQLLIGGFPCPVLYLTQRGYDTHAFQGEVHAELLRELDRALSAFQRDLVEHHLQDRVATFVYSEFGRRVKENGSRGTDHGAGAPCLLLSGAARGGVHGTSSVLDDLEDGDVRSRLDFRAVYSTLMKNWLEVPPEVAIAGEWSAPDLLRVG